MATFIKAQAASLTATAVDFGLTVLLGQGLHVWYLLASVIGTVSGGIVNFSMNRSWVFNAKTGKRHRQAIRYVIVWIGNLLLVTGGVFVLKEYAKLDAVLSKAIVSVVVGICYNYVLQKKFVFNNRFE